MPFPQNTALLFCSLRSSIPLSKCSNMCVIREVFGDGWFINGFKLNFQNNQRYHLMQKSNHSSIPTTTLIITERRKGVLSFCQTKGLFLSHLKISKREFSTSLIENHSLPNTQDGFAGDWMEMKVSVYFLLSSSSAEGCLSRLGRAGCDTLTTGRAGLRACL